MTFDEQLQRALDTFSARLRDEVDRQVRSVGEEVAAVAHIEQAAAEKTASEAIARAEALERAALEMNEKFAAQSAEKRDAAEAAAATGRVAAAIRTMSDSRSLTEVLDTLVRSAGAEARRVGVLLIRDERLSGWRFVGFDASFDNAPAVTALPSGQGSVNVPLTIGGAEVALLYADAGPEIGGANSQDGTVKPQPGTVNLEAVEILARFASQRLEALTAMKAAREMAESTERAESSGRAGRSSANQLT